MKPLHLAPVVAAIAIGLLPAPASAQVRYELPPVNFWAQEYEIFNYRGDYTLTGYIETDGRFGELTVGGGIRNIVFNLSGPINGQIRLDAPIWGTVQATPDTLSISPSGFLGANIPSNMICSTCSGLFTFGESPFGGHEPQFEFTIYEDSTPGRAMHYEGAIRPDGVVAVNNGTVPGSTPALPILPTAAGDPAACGGCLSFEFENAPSGWWFDPPVAEGYEYAIQPGSGAHFTSILDFPPGFDEPFTVTADGVTLGGFGPGEPIDFVAVLGHGVESFRVTGLAPDVDAEDPQAFPIRLAFDQPFASFTMTAITAVPEPGAALLMVGGLLLSATLAPRRPAQA